MSAAADLRAARALLADPARMTRGTYARNAAGKPVEPNAPEAVCWCGLGALFKIETLWAEGIYPGLPFLNAAATELFGSHPSAVGDERSHADNLRLFDRAIELAEVQS